MTEPGNDDSGLVASMPLQQLSNSQSDFQSFNPFLLDQQVRLVLSHMNAPAPSTSDGSSFFDQRVLIDSTGFNSQPRDMFAQNQQLQEQLLQPTPIAEIAMRHSSQAFALEDERNLRTLADRKIDESQIQPMDVLCGRGGRSNNHPGNKHYRSLISDMREKYRGIHGKKDKTGLGYAIVDYIQANGGRFLKQDKATGKYIVLNKAEARRKTSQALRETKELKWTM
jgi:hypothetical protein